NEIPPLQMRMRSIGTQRRAACVPAEVMQFVADVGQIQFPGDFAVGLRSRVDIDYQKCIATRLLIRSQCGDIGVALNWPFHGSPSSGLKSWIAAPSIFMEPSTVGGMIGCRHGEPSVHQR